MFPHKICKNVFLMSDCTEVDVPKMSFFVSEWAMESAEKGRDSVPSQVNESIADLKGLEAHVEDIVNFSISAYEKNRRATFEEAQQYAAETVRAIAENLNLIGNAFMARVDKENATLCAMEEKIFRVRRKMQRFQEKQLEASVFMEKGPLKPDNPQDYVQKLKNLPFDNLKSTEDLPLNFSEARLHKLAYLHHDLDNVPTSFENGEVFEQKVLSLSPPALIEEDANV